MKNRNEHSRSVTHYARLVIVFTVGALGFYMLSPGNWYKAPSMDTKENNDRGLQDQRPEDDVSMSDSKDEGHGDPRSPTGKNERGRALAGTSPAGMLDEEKGGSAWLKYPRTDFELAFLLVNGLQDVKLSQLVRHVKLNVSDREINSSDIQALGRLLANGKRNHRASLQKYGKAFHKEVSRVISAGLYSPVDGTRTKDGGIRLALSKTQITYNTKTGMVNIKYDDMPVAMSALGESKDLAKKMGVMIIVWFIEHGYCPTGVGYKEIAKIQAQ